MSVAYETPRLQYLATGGETEIQFNFEITRDEDLDVYRTPNGIDPDDTTQILELNVDYTVSSDEVILVVPASAGDKYTIERTIGIDRLEENDFATAGKFQWSELDFNFDKVTLIEADNEMFIRDRGLLYQATETITKPRDTALPILPANYGWAMNSAGTEIITFYVHPEGFAPASATYILQTPEIDLPNSQALSDLPTGLLKNTTATGVLIEAQSGGIDYIVNVGDDPSPVLANNLDANDHEISNISLLSLSDVESVDISRFSNDPTLADASDEFLVSQKAIKAYVDFIAGNIVNQIGTYYVGKHGNDSNTGKNINHAFLTVQKALDTADDGDTIFIYPGIYQENLIIPDKKLVINGVHNGLLLESIGVVIEPNTTSAYGINYTAVTHAVTFYNICFFNHFTPTNNYIMLNCGKFNFYNCKFTYIVDEVVADYTLHFLGVSAETEIFGGQIRVIDSLNAPTITKNIILLNEFAALRIYYLNDTSFSAYNSCTNCNIIGSTPSGTAIIDIQYCNIFNGTTDVTNESNFINIESTFPIYLKYNRIVHDTTDASTANFCKTTSGQITSNYNFIVLDSTATTKNVFNSSGEVDSRLDDIAGGTYITGTSLYATAGLYTPQADSLIDRKFLLQNVDFGFGIGATINEISTDTSLSDNSDEKISTQRALKIYIDSHVGIVDESDTLYVGKHGNDTVNNGKSIEQAFLTVQKAIDTASQGTTIYICPGIYSENISINVPILTIKSLSEESKTVIETTNAASISFGNAAAYINIIGIEFANTESFHTSSYNMFEYTSLTVPGLREVFFEQCRIGFIITTQEACQFINYTDTNANNFYFENSRIEYDNAASTSSDKAGFSLGNNITLCLSNNIMDGQVDENDSNFNFIHTLNGTTGRLIFENCMQCNFHPSSGSSNTPYIRAVFIESIPTENHRIFNNHINVYDSTDCIGVEVKADTTIDSGYNSIITDGSTTSIPFYSNSASDIINSNFDSLNATSGSFPAANTFIDSVNLVKAGGATRLFLSDCSLFFDGDTVAANKFSDDVTLAGDSSNTIVSEHAIKTYMDTHAGATTFLALTDTFSAFTLANSIVKVNGTTTGLVESNLTVDAAGNVISVGTVNGASPAEMGYLSGVTSGIQAQLNAKLEAVIDDTLPRLGGDLDVNNHKLTSNSTDKNIIIQPYAGGYLNLYAEDANIVLGTIGVSPGYIVLGGTVNMIGNTITTTTGNLSFSTTSGAISLSTGSGSNENIFLIPDGTGNIKLDGGIDTLGNILTTTTGNINIQGSAAGGDVNIAAANGGDVYIHAELGTGNGTVNIGQNIDDNTYLNTFKWLTTDGNFGDAIITDGSGNLSLAAVGGSLPDQTNAYYVGKNGDDLNSGLSLTVPKLTLTSANTAAGSTTSKFCITDIGTYTGDSFTTIDDSEYDCRGATFSNSNIILKAGVSFSCHKFLVTSGDGIKHYSSADSDPTYFNTDVVSASGSGRAILNEGNSGNVQYHRIGILLHSSSNSCITHQLGTTCFDIDEIRTSGTATGNIFNISGDANTRAYIKIKKLDASGLNSSTPVFNIAWGTVYIECDEIIGVSSTYQLFSTSSNATVHLNGKKIINALINNSLGNIKYYNLDTALLNFNPPKNLLVSGDFSKIPLWIKGVGLSSFADASLVTPSFLILHNATADVQRNTSNQNELVLQLTSPGYIGGYEPLYNDEFSTYLTDLKAAGEKLSVGFYGRATGITSIKMDIIQWVPSTNNACLKDPITTWGSTPTLSSNATGAWSYVANSPTLTISGSNAVIKWEDISLSSFNTSATRLGLLIRTTGSESSGDALIIKKIAMHRGYSFVGFEDRDEIKKTETRIACSYNNNIVIGAAGQMASAIHSCFAHEVDPDMMHAAHFNYNTTLIAVPVVAEANAYNPFNGTAGQVRELDGTNGTIETIDSLSQHSITILEEPDDGWSYNFKMHVVVHPKPYQ